MRILIAAAALAAATPCAAQQPPLPPPGGGPNGQPTATIVAEPVAVLIAACDANGDARVTQVELAPCLARSFAVIDTGASGTLGYIGYSDWALWWLGDRNALPSPFSVDNDNDNRITPVELQTQFAKLFARFDADKDGAVSRAELLTIKSGARPSEPPRGRRGRGAAPAAKPLRP